MADPIIYRYSLDGNTGAIRGLWIDAGGIKSPGAKPATAIAHGALETPAWQFGNEAVAGNQETISFNLRLPNDRSAVPQICVGWSTTTIYTDDSTDNETASWQLEYVYTALNEDTTAAAEETIIQDTVLTAATPAEGLVVTTFTGINLPSDTDVCMHCRIKRLSAGTDTIADTLELHGVVFQYTANKLGTAP